MSIAVRGVLILMLFGLLGDTGAGRGRDGNALFEKGSYAEAASAYQDGLAALSDTTGAVYTALHNNLGLALYRQGRPGAARQALTRARRAATTNDQRTRILFNSGNVAAEMGDVTAALRHYRRVLLLDPTHEAARFNYEFLRRRDGRAASQEGSDLEPSPYAQRLRREAESLVARAQYTRAAALMRDGLRTDSTVAAYRDYIRRIEEIAQITREQP